MEDFVTKPLWRWTCGPCLSQGLEILAESIYRTTRAMGVDAFDWMVCYNSITRESLEYLQRAIGDLPVTLHAQNWIDCPIDDEMRTPRRIDGSYEGNGNICGGTLWKVSPSRMRRDAHEIVVDNDVVVLKKFPQIDEFLASTDKAVILEEPIRFYGRYNHLMPEAPFLNSGFMGLPPGYDFGAAIRQSWEEHGRFTKISQADEQGLLMYTLSKQPSLRVKPHQMKEVLARDMAVKITGDEQAIHFTQANRIPSHVSWKNYKRLVGQRAVL
jgi:hypothetical protein